MSGASAVPSWFCLTGIPASPCFTPAQTFAKWARVTLGVPRHIFVVEHLSAFTPNQVVSESLWVEARLTATGLVPGP
jgi:hypothetical protein